MEPKKHFTKVVLIFVSADHDTLSKRIVVRFRYAFKIAASLSILLPTEKILVLYFPSTSAKPRQSYMVCDKNQI